MHRQFGEQAIRLVFEHLQMHRFVEMVNRLQQAIDNELGQHVGDADHHAGRTAPRRPLLHDAGKLLAELEDLVGVLEDELARLGEADGPSGAAEERRAECPFQRRHLSADGRLRQLQQLAGTSDAPFAGHGPEIQQMVVVQPVHW